MHTISVQKLNAAFGDRDILLNISFSVHQNSRIALAGANGSGKTTLMKILASLHEPDSGTVEISRGTTVAYLPQHADFFADHTLYREAEGAFERFEPLKRRIREVEDQLTGCDPGTPPTAGLLEEHDRLHQELVGSSYYDRERIIYRVLFGLGFSTQDLQRSCREFSGGWRMRIALARILLSSPDILLLDEPTNYLDIDARIWLTEFLRSYHGGVMLVSHDRQFLDDTVTEIFSLFHGSIKRYTGNYSDFERRQQADMQQLLEAYEQQQKEIARIEQFIQRFRYKATKAAQVQSRVTQLEKMERIEIPPHMKRIGFSFPEAPRCGREVLQLKDVSKSYGSLQVLDSFDLTVTRGERIAVTGRNGAGKSTLMRIIAGEDREFSGPRVIGKDVRIGYFQQNIDEVITGTRTVLEEAESSVPEHIRPSVRNFLGAFLFHGDDVFKELNVLSGGEKSRLQLVKLLLQSCNVLVLDEPTNHLDITSQEILMDALDQFTGTLLFVSHEQSFIRRLAGKIVYFSQEKPRIYEGDYEYMRWRQSRETPQEPMKAAPALQDPPGDAKIRHQEHKRLRNRLRSLEHQEHEIIEAVETLEERLQELQQCFSLPEYYQDGTQLKQLQDAVKDTEARHHDLLERWNEVTQEISACRKELA